jgi:hypothetical protein
LVKQSVGVNLGGYVVPAGAAQLNVVPWVNVNQIPMYFDGVLTYIDGVRTIQAEDLTVHGVNVHRYSFADAGGAPAFDYDPLTHLATWRLSQKLPADRLLLELDADADTGGVHDQLGTYLDGDWVNGADVYPSGNGVEGGDFLFGINVLPGDTTRDGVVSALDLTDVRRRMNTRAADPLSTDPSAYSPFADVNADGRINALDAAAVRQRLNTRLPEATAAAQLGPAAPTSSPPDAPSLTRDLFAVAPILG